MTPEFLDFAGSVKIAMVAVDEAHCISQWGQDFRPSYLRITEFVRGLPRRPVVSAFTATATREVRDDILDMLELQNPTVVTTGFDRGNLFFAVQTPKDRYQAIRAYLEAHPGQSGIIYCLTPEKCGGGLSESDTGRLFPPPATTQVCRTRSGRKIRRISSMTVPL